MRTVTVARTGSVLAALLCAALSALSTPLLAHADDAEVGTVQWVTQGGVDLKVETPAIGAPPAPNEYVIYAQRPGLVFPRRIGPCYFVNASSLPYCNLPDTQTGTSCADACDYCWQRGYRPCTYLDPVDQECAGSGQSTPAHVKSTWDASSGTAVEVWLQWSSGCQSNWSTGQLDGDVGLEVAMVYGKQPQWGQNTAINYDGNTAYTTQSGNQAYSNMLYGGSGAQDCTTALGMVEGGDPTEWRHTSCV